MTVVTETRDHLEQSWRRQAQALPTRRVVYTPAQRRAMALALAKRWEQRAAAHARLGEFSEASDAESEAADLYDLAMQP